jgi:hypothetical protein
MALNTTLNLLLGAAIFIAARWACQWLEATWGQILCWRIDRHPERFTWVWCPSFDDEPGYRMPQTRLDCIKARWTHQPVWEGFRNWWAYRHETIRGEWQPEVGNE